jgi:hypothetical protein
MKNLILLLALLLLVSVFAEAQSVGTKTIALRGLTSGTLFSGKAYVASQSDTSSGVSFQNYKYAYVRLNTLDSIGAAVVWYRPLISGSTYGTKVTIGTTSATPQAAGYFEAFALPASALSCSKVQIGVTFGAADAGVTSATYKLDVLVK